MKNYAIILASGKGTRFGNSIPKQFIKISDKTILEYTIDIFEKNPNIDKIILVITEEYIQKAKEITSYYKKIDKIISGGETRKQSSYIGVNSIDELEANVIIHDCARPFLSDEILNNCIASLKTYDAIVTAIPTTDTIIKFNNNIVEKIPDRQNLMRVQTPQCFKLSLIKKAHQISKNDNHFTDDCGLIVENRLAQVHIVNGDEKNIKITYPIDIKIANEILNTD